jgi:DNA-3-methyladenine glycosylase
VRRNVPEFLLGPADEAAPLLLGWHVISRVGGMDTEVMLSELEAYSPDDPASHAFNGLRPRNAAMFGPPGTLYVYRSYGIHWCANVVCGDEETGAAVLVRGGVAVAGIEHMVSRRGRSIGLLDGPGKVAQALGIDLSHNGLDLFEDESPIRLVQGEAPGGIRATPRIGISKAIDRPWRFVSITAQDPNRLKGDPGGGSP